MSPNSSLAGRPENPRCADTSEVPKPGHHLAPRKGRFHEKKMKLVARA
jgi:hypothetical protein